MKKKQTPLLSILRGWKVYILEASIYVEDDFDDTYSEFIKVIAFKLYPCVISLKYSYTE